MVGKRHNNRHQYQRGQKKRRECMCDKGCLPVAVEKFAGRRAQPASRAGNPGGSLDRAGPSWQVGISQERLQNAKPEDDGGFQSVSQNGCEHRREPIPGFVVRYHGNSVALFAIFQNNFLAFFSALLLPAIRMVFHHPGRDISSSIRPVQVKISIVATRCFHPQDDQPDFSRTTDLQVRI